MDNVAGHVTLDTHSEARDKTLAELSRAPASCEPATGSVHQKVSAWSMTMAREDLYRQVTNSIVAELEKGVAPWIRPWKTLDARFGGAPFNGFTERGYRGVNVCLLCIAAQKSGYDDPRWFTYRQARELGAQVRRGEKSTMVIFWKERRVQETDSVSGATKEKKVPLLRSYHVFNAAQCEGIAPLDQVDIRPPELRYKAASDLIDGLGVMMNVGGDMAYFVPSSDVIHIPRFEAFESEEHYWSTYLHELTHWTGHKSRLNRNLANRFGSEAYAAEELVAEMGAAFLCGSLGISGRLRHPEYIGHWLEVLEDDKRAVFKASSLAQAAADFVLNRKVDNTESSETCPGGEV